MCDISSFICHQLHDASLEDGIQIWRTETDVLRGQPRMKAPFTAIMKSPEQTALFLRAVKNVQIL